MGYISVVRKVGAVLAGFLSKRYFCAWALTKGPVPWGLAWDGFFGHIHTLCSCDTRGQGQQAQSPASLCQHTWLRMGKLAQPLAETEVETVTVSCTSCWSSYSGPPLGWGSCFQPWVLRCLTSMLLGPSLAAGLWPC